MSSQTTEVIEFNFNASKSFVWKIQKFHTSSNQLKKIPAEFQSRINEKYQNTLKLIAVIIFNMINMSNILKMTLVENNNNLVKELL